MGWLRDVKELKAHTHAVSSMSVCGGKHRQALDFVKAKAENGSDFELDSCGLDFVLLVGPGLYLFGLGPQA
ncbi:hypothetical protein FNV43_RR03155 [Rhamnella rubrinervis]|uniref:Uncharacterized protein n=1 Tax=Rhamnella rubrinervis TaxID=2594499 RepID=A0A8K0MNL8_9ROSA|nr:hypothetical protein FNV43_RR03155 [Rhamnella rubrinervis]